MIAQVKFGRVVKKRYNMKLSLTHFARGDDLTGGEGNGRN
jgi:hypothetical protein